MKSLVIVADSSFVIETIRLALRSSAGFTVAGEVDGGGPVAAPIAETRPDVVLARKLGVSNRTEASRYAHAHDLRRAA